MSKIAKSMIYIFLIQAIFMNNIFSMDAFDNSSKSYNQIKKNVADTDNIDDPLRKGSYNIGQSTNNIINNTEITDSKKAKETTTAFVSRIINYFLGLLSLVALIYIIYHGFLIVTAAGEEAKQKKGYQGIKTAIVALVGIGLAWFMVSFIFWLIETMTKK